MSLSFSLLRDPVLLVRSVLQFCVRSFSPIDIAGDCWKFEVRSMTHWGQVDRALHYSIISA